jgi:hypothetical protein
MPDQRRHRGQHPQDAELFAPSQWSCLHNAVCDFSWLLSRSYADPSALKVVGDRYNLTQRQRIAVMRCACTDDALKNRSARQIPPQSLAGQELLLDGYNVLTTVEAALSGGVILLARDQTFRDMASIHGTYRKVEETPPALALIGRSLADLRVAQSTWYLDSPVSNSLRLKTLILQIASQHNWPWQVEVVPDPDPVLSASTQILATADSVILDCCQRWFNLARHIVTQHVPTAYVIDLAPT